MIDNGSTTVGFPKFTILAKTHKGITLYADFPPKDQHSQLDHTNIPNDFKHTTTHLIHNKAAIPTRYTNESAAFDLHSVEQVYLKPGEINKINTGVNVHLSQSSFEFITSRSGIATKHGIMVPTGPIDRNYSGKISVVLQNLIKATLSIKEGMRVAQLLILQFSTPTLHVTHSEQFTSRG